jgi:hypothetical protein
MAFHPRRFHPCHSTACASHTPLPCQPNITLPGGLEQPQHQAAMPALLLAMTHGTQHAAALYGSRPPQLPCQQHKTTQPPCCIFQTLGECTGLAACFSTPADKHKPTRKLHCAFAVCQPRKGWLLQSRGSDPSQTMTEPGMLSPAAATECPPGVGFTPGFTVCVVLARARSAQTPTPEP